MGFSSSVNAFKAASNCFAVSGLSDGSMIDAGGGRRGTELSTGGGHDAQPLSQRAGKIVSSLEAFRGFTVQSPIRFNLAVHGFRKGVTGEDSGVPFSACNR